jgi:cyclopropane-fatty-acyl-phospholipid synthase
VERPTASGKRVLEEAEATEQGAGMAIVNAVQTLWRPIISRVLDEVLADFGNKTFQVRFWDGATWGTSDHPKFTLLLCNPEAFSRLFVSPSELSLGEAYIAGDFDVEGDMAAAFELGDYLLSRKRTQGISQLLGAVFDKMQSHNGRASTLRSKLCGPAHSKKRDSQAIRYHYDLPPDFFALWLDPYMMYSCAYFANGDNADLDAAQDRKLEYICRKLRLRRGEHLLDIGCGWGGLIHYATAHYGVQARGITLSLRQAEVARKRIHDAGLDRQCRIEVCDYRDLESDDQFDKIVSVGMFEHVGEALLSEYFKRTWQLLRPGGAFLNSGIASTSSHCRHDGPSFIDRYVFPDGELVPLDRSIRVAEASGFEVRDVESLREHYAMTLHQWVRRLEDRAERVRTVTSETTYRIWRLYMSGSEHQFRSGALNLYQMLLAKPLHGETCMPLTRADWYGKGKSCTADLR